MCPCPPFPEDNRVYKLHACLYSSTVPYPKFFGPDVFQNPAFFLDFKTVLWFVYVYYIISPVESRAAFCYQAHYYYCCKMYKYSH